MKLVQFRKGTDICIHCFTKQVAPDYFQCVNCGLVETTEEINRRYENK